MSKKIALILNILILFVATGCAWENLPEGEEEDQRIIEVTMRLGGAIVPEYFYYIVFNVSGDDTMKPYSIFEGEDRGKYWHVYYMVGQPPFRAYGLYRGRGGLGPGGEELIDKEPVERSYLNELLPGTDFSGDRIHLKIDLSEFASVPAKINMNMIVCNQAIDERSRYEYELEPVVWDSFYQGGITMNLSGIDDFWDEMVSEHRQEDIPNEYEELAVPGADIKGWHFEKIAW